jgi:hypothetical protein
MAKSITQAISMARTIMKRVVCLALNSACTCWAWVSSARFAPWLTNSFMSPFACVISANVGTARAIARNIPAATIAFLFVCDSSFLYRGGFLISVYHYPDSLVQLNRGFGFG